ncbi:MAG: hypothetical protein QXY01_05545 [Candidatus Bathyarchaeia archaeon]
MEDHFKPLIKGELEQALEDLKSLQGSLRRGGPRVDLWRPMERLEYAAFLLSITFGLMDYDPNHGDMEKIADGDEPSKLVELLTGCLEALERDDPKRCYDGVKALVKILGSLIGGRGR